MVRIAIEKRNLRKCLELFLIVLMLSGCKSEKEPVTFTDNMFSAKKAEAEELKCISDIPTEKCKLCGKGEGTLLPLYWGEDNIGIISVNTFELAYIRINRYDDNGKLIEKAENGISERMTITGEDNFSYRITENSNRAFANCTLYFKFEVFKAFCAVADKLSESKVSIICNAYL